MSTSFLDLILGSKLDPKDKLKILEYSLDTAYIYDDNLEYLAIRDAINVLKKQRKNTP